MWHPCRSIAPILGLLVEVVALQNCTKLQRLPGTESNTEKGKKYKQQRVETFAEINNEKEIQWHL